MLPWRYVYKVTRVTRSDEMRKSITDTARKLEHFFKSSVKYLSQRRTPSNSMGKTTYKYMELPWASK